MADPLLIFMAVIASLVSLGYLPCLILGFTRGLCSTVTWEMGNVLAVWLAESLGTHQTLEIMCLVSSPWRRNEEEFH